MSLPRRREALIASADPVDVGAELRLGIDLHRQGRPLEAEQCLQRVLQHEPASFEALHLLGVIAAQSGRTNRAVDLIRQAIGRNDQVATAHLNLGLALKELGRPEEAVASLERAIALRPDLPASHVNLSAVFIDLRRFESALESATQALALDGNAVRAHLNRAAALRGLGRLAEALESYDRALAAPGGNTSAAWVARGHVLMELGLAQQGLASYQQALALTPDSAEALSHCGWALLQLNRQREALACYERALRQGTSSAAVHANCAAVYLALKRPEAALMLCERALGLQPDLFEAHYNRGSALHALHRHAAACAAFDHALSLRPQSAAAHCELGNARREMDEREAAKESYDRALQIEPEHAAARLGRLLAAIPVIPGSREEVDRSRLELAAELARFTAWAGSGRPLDEVSVVAKALPFHLAYQEYENKELLTRWGSMITGLMERWAQRTPHAVPPGIASDSRVRLGIVTSHAYQHSVFRALLKGWLEHLDRDSIRVTVFHLGVSQDAATAVVRSHAEWVDCSEHSLQERVAEIRSRNIEVLIYPEVGMDGGTFQLASLRVARHQIAAWGHPETTGLPTIDYFLSAEAFEPPAAQHNYAEQLIALPGIGCCYEPFGIAASADRSTFGIAPDVPLLLCAGTPQKYAAEHDGALIEIARALGRCQIVFFEASQQTLTARVLERLRAEFRDAGLDPGEYLRMLPWLTLDEFFGLMRHADVYLDTQGFSGFNTVMQAVECGLPIVAYEGRFMRGRFASGVLRSLGLDELVAGDDAGYVQRAVALARDAELREVVRARLRNNREQLYRNRSPVDALSQFISGLPRPQRGRA